MIEDDVHKGGCLCGVIRFEAKGTPLWKGYCHCAFCRRQSGAPVAAFADFRISDGFRWIKGRPARYRSSPALTRLFCRACGTPLAHQADHRRGEIDIAIGAFDDPARLAPTEHAHCNQKIAWFPRMESPPPVPEGVGPDAAAVPR